MNDDLYHHGVQKQRWGVRRYQNYDGTLTEAGKRHRAKMEKKDVKWAKKNYDRIMNKAQKGISKELNSYKKELMNDRSSYNSNGKISSKTINLYNQKMADLMNKSSKDIAAPSGRVVKYVAKRGDVGVHMILADQRDNMSQLKNGLWDNGRVAYRSNKIDVS